MRVRPSCMSGCTHLATTSRYNGHSGRWPRTVLTPLADGRRRRPRQGRWAPTLGVVKLLAGADAVLFDLDDTLLEYTQARDAGFLRWLAELDATRPGDPLREWQDLEDHHFRRYSAGEITFSEQRRERLRAFWPRLRDATDVELDGLYETFVAHMETAWAPVPHAADVVRAVAEHALVGILTNGHHEMQTRKLALLGLEDLPLYASSALPAAKPDVRAYEAACSDLGVAPLRTVMVGDDILNDVEGAMLAGLRAIWFDRGRGGTVPAPSITDLRQLLD